ncbi:MAG: hypothetical protein HYZ53_29120 [Planctomycetes bacterium]|nr:hypothetical protein [Planctomycetota bacterium]
MLLFKGPKWPTGFANEVRAAEEVVRKDIAAGRAPRFDERIWKRHKSAFIAAQHGKCGYCEVSSLNHPGAVEHYAPKSAIQELAAEGAELAPTATVHKRKTRTLCDTGYWWLAYNWDNWLFACERCNSAWKRGLFPIREKRRMLPPRRGMKETPLLLNPFGTVEPSDHLCFSRVGQVSTRDHSDHGDATIQVCGLDRESLRRVREGIAADTYRHVDRLFVGLLERNVRKAHDAVDDLLSLGTETRAHAGMVRSIVRAQLGLPWTDLKRLLPLTGL